MRMKHVAIAIVIILMSASLGLLSYQLIKHRKGYEIVSLKNESIFLQYLDKISFTGVWHNKLSTSKILTQESGKASLRLYSNYNPFNYSNNTMIRVSNWQMALILEDPEFYDNNLVQIFLNLESKFEENEEISFQTANRGTSNSRNTFSEHNLKWRGSNFCNYTGTVTFNSTIFEDNSLNFTKLKEIDNALFLNLESTEEDCSLSLTSNMASDKGNMVLQIVLYTLLFVCVGLLNWVGAIKLLTKVYYSITYTHNISLWVLVSVTVQDSFIFILHMTFAIAFIDSASLFLIFFLYFFLFVVVDYRLVLFVWKYQTFGGVNDLQNPLYSRRLYFFQIKLYTLILAYNYLTWRFFMNVWLMALNSLILIPQIVHNVKNPTASKFDVNYLIFYTALKYIIFYYLRSYPQNIYHLRYYYVIPGVGFGCILLSLVILYLQEVRGAAFLVPKTLKPKQHEYFIDVNVYRRLKEDEVSKSEESFFKDDSCSICLDELLDKDSKVKSPKSGQELKVKLHRRKLKQAKRDQLARAPCQHVFHPYCLLQWMEVKMECPCCRANLPQINY